MTQTIADLKLPSLPMNEPSFTANPWPYFDEAREQHPWLATCPFGYVLTEWQAMRDLLWLDHSMIGSYHDVIDIMNARGTPWGRFQEDMLLARNGEDHKRIRNVLAPAFTPQQAEKHRGLMAKTVARLLDEWVPRREIDFEEFASYFPVTVMCSLIGAPTSELPELRSSMEAIGLSQSLDLNHLPALNKATETMDAFVQKIVADRRANPKSDGERDLLSILLDNVDSGKMNDRELYDLLIFLFVAGYDTSKNAMTILMDVLIDRPDIYQRCAEDLAYCRKVVEEGFRYMTTSTIGRVTTKDVTYRDVVIPKGTLLFFPVAISGRDDAAFGHPDEFDPDRPDAKKHLAFGMGAHICLGQFIARAQIQEGLHQIAQRMKNPRRTGEHGWRPFFGVWGLKGLPIAFDPAPARELETA
jgi:cytochrome P450